jgi:hypothetical protein
MTPDHRNELVGLKAEYSELERRIDEISARMPPIGAPEFREMIRELNRLDRIAEMRLERIYQIERLYEGV